jgi:hypothetical protein
MVSGTEPPQALKEILHWDELRKTSLGRGLTDNWVNIAMMLFFLVMAGGRYLANSVSYQSLSDDFRS